MRGCVPRRTRAAWLSISPERGYSGSATVIGETPAVGLYFADGGLPRRQELARRFLAEMIARDRNRACVIGWSVANEPRMNNPRAADALRELCDAARALDGSRPVGYAFVAGTHIWAFADFATAQADHRPQSVNFKGVFTRDRQPKLAARRLRDLWQG